MRLFKRLGREALPEIIAALVAALVLELSPGVRSWLLERLNSPLDLRVWEVLLLAILGMAAGGLLTFLYFKRDLLSGKIDRLTKTWNAGQIDPFLERRINDAAQKSSTFAVLLVDVDNFKHINDRFDHEIGSHVLAELVTVIRPRTKGEEIFRYGGDEFLIVTNIGTDERTCAGYGNRVVRDASKYEFIGGNVNSPEPLKLTVSCGCFLATGSETVTQIREYVVTALKLAKGPNEKSPSGKNTSFVYDPSHSQIGGDKRTAA